MCIIFNSEPSIIASESQSSDYSDGMSLHICKVKSFQYRELIHGWASSHFILSFSLTRNLAHSMKFFLHGTGKPTLAIVILTSPSTRVADRSATSIPIRILNTCIKYLQLLLYRYDKSNRTQSVKESVRLVYEKLVNMKNPTIASI